MQLSEVRLRGCAVVWHPNGNVTIWPPKLDERTDSRRAVHFSDEQLKREIAELAIDVLKAMGRSIPTTCTADT
ncbi:hypothetical protein ACFQBU_07495 [Jhaorihella thermophila]